MCSDRLHLSYKRPGTECTCISVIYHHSRYFLLTNCMMPNTLFHVIPYVRPEVHVLFLTYGQEHFYTLKSKREL